MPIAEGIAAAKAAFEVSKIALDLTRHPKLDNDAIHSRLLELQGLILSAQASLGDALEENRELRRENAELKQTQVREADLEFQDGVYWYKGWPLCPTCWLRKKEFSRLTGPFGMDDHYRCQFDSSQFHLTRTPKDKS
jgi:hypothetical protein